MKNYTQILIIFFFTGIFLTSCVPLNQLFNPTPPPPLVAENERWQIKVLSIQKFNDPIEFNCTICDQTYPEPGLSLQEKNWYLVVSTQIFNKTDAPIDVDEITIGLMLNIFTYGCGGVTVAGTDYCLPSGMIRGGERYINHGVDSPGFEEYLTFPPSEAEGEIVDFVFIVKSRGRHMEFYFDNLQPINIKKLKPTELPDK